MRPLRNSLVKNVENSLKVRLGYMATLKSFIGRLRKSLNVQNVKTLSSISNLNKHRKAAHLRCNLNYAYIENIKKSASLGVEICCKFCDKKFSRKDALKRHIKTVHKNTM